MKFNNFLKIAFATGLGVLCYLFIYSSPLQKKMDQEIISRTPQNTFIEGFEKATSVSDLFKDDWSGWHELLIQSNTASHRRPVKYCLLQPLDCLTSPALGNYIELSQTVRRRGNNALKFTAQPFSKLWFGNSRVAIRRHLFDFGKGDDIYFSGWFYFEGPEGAKGPEADNLNFLDFISFRSRNDSLRNFGEPGASFFFSFRNYIGLKFDNWLPAMDEVQQDILNRTQMPLNQWTEIKIHLKLSDEESEGLVEVWIDDKKVLADRAKTLPDPDMVYSILEIGVGSNLNQTHGQTMYVDNIYVSPTRFQ